MISPFCSMFRRDDSETAQGSGQKFIISTIYNPREMPHMSRKAIQKVSSGLLLFAMLYNRV